MEGEMNDGLIHISETLTGVMKTLQEKIESEKVYKFSLSVSCPELIGQWQTTFTLDGSIPDENFEEQFKYYAWISFLRMMKEGSSVGKK